MWLQWQLSPSFSKSEDHLLICRIWFYWGCNPLSYAQKGMAINEFRAPRWQSITVGGGSSETVGDAVLAQRGLPRNGYNRALAFCVLVSLPLWLALMPDKRLFDVGHERYIIKSLADPNASI